jgi:Flp pilus assembly protein TadG
VVEFALLVPILLLIVFGLIQYGMYFWAMQGGSDIARSAARMSAVGDPATCADFRDNVSDEIDSLTGTGSTATITRDYSPDSDVTVGDTVVVEVAFDSFDLQLPFLPFVDDGRVTTTAEARVDYVPEQPEECP